ncbi:MAG: YcxB family protein [Flavobacteriales bacterium]|nr:YcxB family protein [Flavobacteriales bacterium]MCB9198698.1 YcxB family protein [Flavobacteriales bacterium]
MEINYHIKEIDYLTHQLYNASRNKRLKKKRNFIWLVIPFIYGGFGYMAYFHLKQPNLGKGFMILGSFWLVTYPFYSRWNYKRQYRNHIKDNLKAKIDQKVTLIESPSHIIIKDQQDNQSKIAYESLKEIVELPQHFLILLNTNSAIILPKDEFKDIKELQLFLGRMVKNHKVKFSKELNWKWR